MDEIKDLTERIVSLETRAAFQEKTIDDLSAVLAQQYSTIETLVEKLAVLQEQLGSGANAGIVEKGRDEIPPHY